MNAIAPIEVPSASVALVPHNMDEAIKLAQLMSTAKLVPKHLQGDVGSCLMVVEQAMRWRMSPFAVAQCTSNISGKLMYEGKLVAAVVETSGAIEGGFDYTFKGEGDERSITISAKRTGETNPRQMTIRLQDVRTTNEHWKKQPDQQLVYSSARNWARRWTPSVILGVYSPEEFDRKKGAPFDGPTIEAEAEAVNNSASMQIGGTGLPDAGGNGDAAPPTWLEHYTAALTNERSLAQFVVTFADACATCSSEPDLVRLMGIDIVRRALEKGAPEVKDQLTKASSNAFRRLTPPAATQPGLALDAEPWNPETGEITPEERARA